MKVLNLASVDVLERARQRGYSPDSIKPCVVKALPNGRWLVDVESKYYPHSTDSRATVMAAATPPKSIGPGGCLKVILSWMKIRASEGCSCNKRAMAMDEMGRWQCLRRIREISGWLGEEAAKRRMPYRPWKGYVLVISAVAMSLAKQAVQSIRR